MRNNIFLQSTYIKPDINDVEAKVKEFLKSLNLPVDSDEHLKDTPKRIAKMFVNELFAGLYTSPPKVTEFEDKDSSDTIITIDNIQVKSVCSHHFVAFYGKACVIYMPKDNRIIGLSKFSRIVDYFARRPQVQERLTQQVAKYIYDVANPWLVIVGMKCRHLCLSCRGANDTAVMTTIAQFKHPQDSTDVSGYLSLMHSKLNMIEV